MLEARHRFSQGNGYFMAAFSIFSTTFCAMSNASLAEVVTPLFWSGTTAAFSVQRAFANVHIGQALGSKDRVKLGKTLYRPSGLMMVRECKVPSIISDAVGVVVAPEGPSLDIRQQGEFKHTTQDRKVQLQGREGTIILVQWFHR